MFLNGHENRALYSTLINCSTEIFQRNLSSNFGLTAVFVKVALQKELRIAFYPDSHVLVLFEIAHVCLRLADCRVCKGHLQNE